MKILITGVCGFVGRILAEGFAAAEVDVTGIDNLSRAGSEVNRGELRKLGVGVVHGDIRSATDVDGLPAADWLIDAAANPSVLAGVDGRTSSRQVVEHNLFGTVNLLEYCRAHGAGFILLSTSRVYSVQALASIEVEARSGAFQPIDQRLPARASAAGISEAFSTEPPLSLYGATKLASEQLALEYGEAFGFPVWINRCGVLGGPGQFGRADQGIFSYWIHSYRARRPLTYIGFGGEGYQVRDCLHPRDLLPLLRNQMTSDKRAPRIVNVSGGAENSMSLAQLSHWCAERFGAHAIARDERPRRFDVPWLVLDSSLAATEWNWRPETPLPAVLEEIARHAERHPDWLEVSHG